MKSAELYHQQRASELGFHEGIGKRYNHEDIEAFAAAPFVEELFKDGTLVFDKAYVEKFGNALADRWRREDVQKNPELQRQALDDIMNHGVFFRHVGFLEGRIPTVWDDADAVVQSYRSAHEQGLQLPQDLIRFGMIHPAEEVRTTLFQTQRLTARQQAIIGYMGVNTGDRNIDFRLQALGGISAPDLQAGGFAAEFAEYPHPQQPQPVTQT